MGQGGRIGYYITGRQSKAGGYTHDYTGIQDSQAYVGFVGIWKMCDLHLDFTSAGGARLWHSVVAGRRRLRRTACRAAPCRAGGRSRRRRSAAGSSCRWLRTSARNLAYSEEGREKLSRRKREWHSKRLPLCSMAFFWWHRCTVVGQGKEGVKVLVHTLERKLWMGKIMHAWVQAAQVRPSRF